MLPRKWAIKMYFIFPPHLTSASALPGETGNPEIASFHLNAACFFNKNTKHKLKLECGPMPNVMIALPNIGGALCSTPQSLADAHYLIAVQ